VPGVQEGGCDAVGVSTLQSDPRRLGAVVQLPAANDDEHRGELYLWHSGGGSSQKDNRRTLVSDARPNVWRVPMTPADIRKLAEEAWRPIPGFEGLYEVSDHGRVRRLRVKGGRREYTAPAIVPVRPIAKGGGYLWVRLYDGHGTVVRTCAIHRLVLTVFVREPKAEEQARHLDGVRTNNCVSNLCWGTAKENAADRERHGTTARGERNGRAKLSANKVRAIQLLHGEYSQRQLAVMFGVCREAIQKVLYGEYWSGVS
jgi:hypothetical protein